MDNKINRPFLSIIIPVYNVENYLRRCVDSILSDNFNDIEIILIDDGSTDHSSMICDQYSLKHDNIKVIHQSNSGASASRNVGIKNAKGLYLMFIDSDDELEENTIYSNVKILEKNPTIDIIQIPISKVNLEGKEDIFCIDNLLIDNTKDIFKCWCTSINIKGYVCGKIIKSSILKQCRFPENITNSEDFYIMNDILSLSSSLYFSNKGKYIYYSRIGSVTTNQIKTYKVCCDVLKGYKYRCEKAFEIGVDNDICALALSDFITIYTKFRLMYINSDFSIFSDYIDGNLKYKYLFVKNIKFKIRFKFFVIKLLNVNKFVNLYYKLK